MRVSRCLHCWKRFENLDVLIIKCPECQGFLQSYSNEKFERRLPIMKNTEEKKKRVRLTDEQTTQIKSAIAAGKKNKEVCAELSFALPRHVRKIRRSMKVE